MLEVVKERCIKYNLNSNDLRKAIKSILYYTDRQLDDASKVLDAFASYIIVSKMAYPVDDSVGRKIVEYIRVNLSEDLSVKALCKPEIYKLSKRYMPVGIANFVRCERMKKATALLVETDATSEQIAEMTGFSDANYFLRTFKKLKGISTGDFKKR